jgi:hypothetical protein
LRPSQVPADIRMVHGALTYLPGERTAPQTTPNRALVALIGGNNVTYDYKGKLFEAFIEQLNSITGGRCVVVLSRRTSAETEKQLRAVLRPDISLVPVSDRAGYEQARAGATHFVVCPDSVTMVSECAASGRPVYVPRLDFIKPDHDNAKFIALNMREAYILPFEEFDWTKSTRKLDDQAKGLAPGLLAAIESWLAALHVNASLLPQKSEAGACAR